MRKIITFAALLLLSGLVACGARENSDASLDTASTSSSDTTGTLVTDSSATTTGSTGGTVSAMSPDDKEFVMKAAMGGMAEVQMGQMAAEKASNKDVKAFGQRMVADHSKANDQLKQLATVKGLALPTEIGEEHKKAADHLAGLSGKAFDKAYMTHMVDDHQKDVAEFQKESTSGQDADLKGWAGATLPTLQEHLTIAQATAKKVR
jgi:putative membrane protein